MANEIGSFVVSIKTQIEGYQEQIEAIKAKLAEVGKDTDIGKEIAKSLKIAESQVDRLGKTVNKRISSESQITALTDNLQNISRLIMDIGDSFGKVTWDDLNVDGLRDKIQSAKSEIDNLTNSMQENVSKGFSEALAASAEMRDVFKTLKIDPAQMGVEEVTEKLRIGLIQATSTLENYKAELDKIIPKAEEAAQKMKSIEIDKSKIEDARNSLSSVFDNLKLITTQTRTVDIFKSDDFFKAIEEKCNSLYDTVNDKGKGIIDKIREIVSWDAVGEKDPEKLRGYLQEINNLFKDLNGRSLSGNITGFGDRINEIFENLTIKNISTSIDGLDKFKIALENLFANNNNFGLDSVDAKNFIDKILNVEATKESIDAAEKEVSRAIKEYLAKVSQEYKTASQDAGTLNTQRKTAQQKYDDAKANSAAIKTAETKYLAEIKLLKDKNAELQTQLDNAVKRLEALEKESESRKTGNNSPMGNFGRQQKQTATQYLNDAASAAGKYSIQLEQVKAREQAIGNIQSFVQRWFSVYAAARLVSNAFRSMKTNLKDLDDIMTQISIVTDKTQGDLWKQMPQYADMAKQYASSIKGVYEVSQLYYQQGLGQNDVMALTEQTLKMAKISGLEYATATDYMTNAIRSFKMEMSDAQQVVDVYSAIAANSATNTAELATAMSKTASSAQSVGSSFESTSAMMAVMIEATRESAENIGSAMKSIISRYGEMTKNPSKLIDSEGEAMSLNKVDTALQSVGISIHDAQGQFRDFDDVITELSGSWDKIDKNTQRYIATIMAGNRQQSRFLALVSNGERLQELTEEAANAEDTATLQVLKTMDSISAKAQQLQTSLQGLYTEGGFEELYKHLLDLSKNVVDTFTGMPKLLGNIPVTAIAMFTQLFINIGGLFTQGLSKLKNHFTSIKNDLTNKIESGSRLGVQGAQQHANSLAKMFESAAARIQNALSSAIIKGTNPSILNSNNANNAFQKIEIDKKTMSPAEQYKARLSNKLGELKRNNSKAGQVAGMSQEEREQLRQNAMAMREAQRAQAINTASEALRGFGAVLQIVSMAMDKTTRSGEVAAGAINLVGGVAATAGYALTGNFAMAAMTAATTIISSLDMLVETAEERAARLKKASEEANNEFLQKNNDFKELDNQIKKLKELEKAQYDSEEAKKEYIEASNQIAEKNPELISGFDSEGNAVINLSASYEQLANARKEASDAADEVIKTSMEEAENAIQTAKENRTKNRHETMQKTGEKKYSDNFPTTNRAALYYSSEVISQEIEGLNEQARYNIANLLSNLGNQNWNTVDLMLENKDVQDALSTLQTNTSELGKTVYNIIFSYISGLKDIDRDIAQKENDKVNKERTDLLKKIDNDNLGKKDEAMADDSQTVLNEFNDAGTLIDNYMLKAFKNWKEKLEKENPGKDHKGNYGSELERFINEEYDEEYDNIYNTLQNFWEETLTTEDTQNEIKSILENKKSYTQASLIQAINQVLLGKGLKTLDSNMIQAIAGYYENSFDIEDFNKAIRKRAKANIDQGKDFLKIRTEKGNTTSQLGESELQQILSIYDDLNNSVNNGLDFNKGQNILNAYMRVWEVTQDMEDATSREIAQSLLSSVEDLSLTELYQLKDSISEVDIPDSYKSEINSAIDNLIEVAPANIAIEFTTFTDDIVAHSEDFGKALSNASKGMNLKDASEMATKLDTSLSNFDFKGGKYFFKDANALQEAYSNYNKDLLSDLQNRYDEQVKELESSKAGKSKSEIEDIDAQIDQMTKAKDNAESAINQWMNYEANSALLQAGQLDTFLDNLGIKEQDKQDITKQITSGNIEKVLLEHPELSDYAKTLIDTYKSINTDINNSLTSSIKNGAQFIEKTDLNVDKFKSLGNLATEVKNANGEVIGYYVEVTKENVNEYIKWVKDNAENLTQNDIKSSLKEAHDLQFPDVVSALQGITSDFVSYDAMQSFVEAIGENAENIDEVARQYGFTVDTITGNFIRGNSTLTALQNKLTELQAEGTDIKAINAVAAQIDTLKNQSQRNALEAAKTILSKQTEVTEDNIRNFADSLGIAYDEMKAAFTMQSNGYYKADMGAIASKMAEAGVAIDSFIAQLFDSAIAAIQGNANIMTSGFSNVESTMADFTELRDLTGEDLKFPDIYRLDPTLHKYVYTTEGLIKANNARSEAIAKQYDNIIAEYETERAKLTSELGTTTNDKKNDVIKKIEEVDEKINNAEQSKAAAEAIENEVDNIEFEKIDFSGIADGTISFAEAYNQLLAYTASLGLDGEEAEKEANELYEALAAGGQVAVDAYRANGGQDSKIEQSLYEGNNAAQEIFEAIKGKADDVKVRLTEAQKKVLGVNTDIITVGDIKAPEMLAKLFEAIGIKLQQGNKTIEEYNADVMQVVNESDSSKVKVSTEALSSAMSDFNVSTLEALANSLGVQLKQGIDIEKAAGTTEGADGKKIISNIGEFLNWVIDNADGETAKFLQEHKEAIESGITVSSQISARSSVVQANITELTAVEKELDTEISNLISAKIGDYVDISTLLAQYTEKSGGNAEEAKSRLAADLGVAREDIENGYLQISNKISMGIWGIISNLFNRNFLPENIETNTQELQISAIQSAISAASSFQVGSIIDAETVKVLQNAGAQLNVLDNGTAVINSAQEYIDAVKLIYDVAKQSFEQNTTDLATLNNSFANLIKANTAQDAAIDSMLSSANNLSTDTLSNFATTLHLELENIVDEFGGVTENWRDSIEGDGKGNYQVTNWDNYIADLEDALGHTIDKTTKGYIDSYINWLDGDMNVASGAKEALMTSLIPNLEKLSYAEIGQIAKTFKMTVDEVLALVEKNGDNTFNAKDLLNVLPFDKTNEEFARALSTQLQSVTSNMTSAIVAFVEAGADGKRTDLDFSNLKNAISDFEKGMQALGQNVSIENLTKALERGGETAVAAAEQIAALSGQELSAFDIEALYRGQVSKLVNAIDTVIAQPGEIVDEITASLIGFDNVNEIGETGQYVVETAANLYEAYNKLLQRMVATGEATLADLNKVAAKALENRDGEQQVIDALGDASSMTYTRFGEILAQKGIELTEDLVNVWSEAGVIKQLGGAKMAITDFNMFADIMGWEAGSEEYLSAFSSYNNALIELNKSAEESIESEISSVMGAQAGDWINLTQLFSKLDKSMEEIFNERYSLDGYNGNVSNLYNRPIVSPEKMAAKYPDYEGDYSTIYGTTIAQNEASKLPENIALLLTPIASLNEVLSQTELTDYVNSLIDHTGMTLEEIKEADAKQKNLLLGLFEGADAIDQAEEYAEKLHQLQEEWDAKTIIGDTRFDPLTVFQTALESLGAKLENGILKIDEEGANIPSILATYSEYIQNYGDLTVSETATLLDSIQDALKAYADLISNAASGSLNHEGANQLQNWATSLGIDDLHFVETANGLKLATDQAFQLAAALEKVDAIQGRLTFEKVADALTSETGSRFSTMSGIMAEIANAQNQIAENEAKVIEAREKGTGLTYNEWMALEEQNNKLQEQIGLYEKIAQYQSRNPESYNFMDQKLPDNMQGPINYWNSVGEAFASMNEAGKTGKMAIQDFYNIITEMNNLVALSSKEITLAGITLDGSAEAAAALIQKGMGALTNIDGKGVKINLEKLGIDFASGAGGAKDNFVEGVHALADSQIAMLDAAIKVLEVVVAMESLGDISVDDNPEFSFGDVFDLGSPPNIDEQGNEWYEFTTEFNTWRENIVSMLTKGSDNYNADLAAAAESIKVNGVSLKEMLESGANTIKELGISQQEYFDILKAFQTAAASGDYDLDNIQESVWEILKNSGLTSNMEIQVGDNTLVVNGGTKVLINWEEPDTQLALKNFQGTEEEQKAALIQAITNYSNGNATSTEVFSVLEVLGKIKVNPETGWIVLPDGREVAPNSESGRQAIAEAALKAAGIDEITDIEYTNDDKFVSVTGTVKVGSQTFMALTDANGNVKWTCSDVLPGAEFNSKEECMRAVAERFQAMYAAEGEEIGLDQIYKEKFGIKFKPIVKLKTDLTDSSLREQALKVTSETKEEIASKVKDPKNTNYTEVSRVNGKVTYNLNGIEVEVEDTGSLEGNIAAAQQKIEDTVDPEGMVDKISQGITNAFTAEDNAIGEAIGKGIISAITGFKTSDLTEEPAIPEIDATLTNLNIKKVENAQMDQGLLGKIFGIKTNKIKIPEADAVLQNVIIKSVENASMAQGVNILGVSVGGAGLVIPNADATITQLNIKSVSGAIVDSTATSGVTPPNIPNMDGTVSNLNIKSISGATVTSAATEEAASEVKPPNIDNLDGTVTTLKITEVGSGEYAAGEDSVAPKIPTLDATVEKLTVDATEVDVTSAAETIAQKLQEALDGKPITPTVNAPESSEGGNPGGNSGAGTIDTSALDNVSSTFEKIGSAGTEAAGKITESLGTIETTEVDAIATAEKSIETTEVDAIATSEKNITTTEVDAIATSESGIGHSNVDDIATAESGIGHSHVTDIKDAEADISTSHIEAVAQKINNIDAPSGLTTNFKISVSKAKGNMAGVAKANGNMPALAGGRTKTLMGELGPELVVSNGRYFLVGQNGAEFVDLANDAIVFNHLQTRRLMEQGAIGSRGKPFINENAAVSLAKGRIPNSGPAKGEPGTQQEPPAPKKVKKNITGHVSPTNYKIDWEKGRGHSNGGSWGGSLGTVEVAAAKGIANSGPAMASAAAALAALKQLRALWESLRNASLQDMGGMPSGGGGGGGGGGTNDETKEAAEGIVSNVERWYNWLALIEEKQNKINILTKEYELLTAKGANNKELAKNLEEQARQLRVQLDTAQQLVEEQTAYRKTLANKMNNGLFGAFYKVDKDTGQIRLSNDDAFSDFVEKNKPKVKQKYKNQEEVPDYLKEYYKNGQLIKGKKSEVAKILGISKSSLKNSMDPNTKVIKAQTIKRTKTTEELGEEFDKLNLKSERKSDPGEKLKEYYTYDENSKKWTLNSDAREEYIKNNRNKTTNVKIGKDIRTGKDFLEELNRTDKAGNAVHNAADQLAMIKSMGLFTDDLMKGVDTEQEGWEATVVQNFFDKIENDKTEMEALNKSIQEQQEAALEYEKAILEINAQYKEMAKPIEAVTDHLENWYEWTRKITTEQHKLNMLSKEYTRLTLRQGDTSSEQVANLREQALKQQNLLASSRRKQDEMKTEREETEKKLKSQRALKNEEKNKQDKKTAQNLLGKKDVKNSDIAKLNKFNKWYQEATANGQKISDKKFISKAEKDLGISDNQAKKLYSKRDQLVDNQNLSIKRKTFENEWFKIDEDGNLVYNDNFSKNMLKNAPKNGKFMTTRYEEKTDENGNYIRRGFHSGEEITKKERDKAEGRLSKESIKGQLSKEDQKILNKIDLDDFSNLADSYDTKSDIPKKYRNLYEEKNGKLVLKENIKKVRDNYNKDKRTVEDYDKGSNIFQTKKVTADFSKAIKEGPEAFIKKLEETDGNGNAIYDGRQQMEILEQMGLGDQMAELAQLESWATAEEKDKIEAAKKYLNHLKETPEAYNELLDKIHENEEAIEEYKNQILEINNQIREMLKPIEGVTDHLEEWYEWTRMTTAAQSELNKLTAYYSNLEKRRALGMTDVEGKNITDASMAGNLKDQGSSIAKKKIANYKTREEMGTKLTQEKMKFNNKDNPMNKFFTWDEERGIIYNNNAYSLQGKKVQVEKQTFRNGKEVKDRIMHENLNKENYTYDELVAEIGIEAAKEAWDTGVLVTEKNDASDDLKNRMQNSGFRGWQTSEDFIKALTAKNVNGKSLYSGQEQTAILEAAGFGQDIAKIYSSKSWDELNNTERNEAAAEFLNTISQYPQGMNELVDASREAEVEFINLDNEILEINSQLKELATHATGITSPFEKWFELTQKITNEQNKLNKLTKEYSNLDKARVVNGNQKAKNLKEQLENLGAQQQFNDEYLNQRKANLDSLVGVNGKLNQNPALQNMFSYSEENGLQFNKKINFNTIRDQANSIYQGIQLTGDIDSNGVYNYTNRQIDVSNFSGISSMSDFFNELTKQNNNGSMAYDVEEQFAIARAAGLEELMKYDSSGNEIFANGIEKATKDEISKGVSALLDNGKNFIDEVESERNEIETLEENAKDLESSVIEIQNQIEDITIDLENNILKAVEELKQAEIDELQDVKDAYSEAADKMIDGLNNQLQKEQNMYNKNESQEEINNLQRRIAILQRSGGSNSEIQSLQKDLASKQKDMYFDERQNQIDAVKEASDLQIERLDKQIEILTETLEYQKENGLLWDEVYGIMEQTPEQIADYLARSLSEYKALSTLQSQNKTTEDLNQAQIYTSFKNEDTDALIQAGKDRALTSDIENQDGINELKIIDGKISGIPEEIKTNDAENKTLLETTTTDIKNILNTVSSKEDDDNNFNLLKTSIEGAGKALEGVVEISDASLAKTTETSRDSIVGALVANGGSITNQLIDNKNTSQNANKENNINLISTLKNQQNATRQTIRNIYSKYLNKDFNDTENILFKIETAIKEVKTSIDKKINGTAIIKKDKQNNSTANITLSRYATGGLNTKPGLAWLDGTPTKPEYVLNAEQTAILREALLGSRPIQNSIANTGYDIINGAATTRASYNTINNGETISLNGISVNINVPAISNDYDARKVGELAMDEMVRIARKTGTHSLSRR